jgi:hypothetical protein
MNAIGVDVGGTKIAAAVVSTEGEILKEVRYPTQPIPPNRLVELLLGPAREEAWIRTRSPSREFVKIKEATLGPKSGVMGAAALARGGDGEYVPGPSRRVA